MISVEKFTFNPFQENTYVVFDESKECLIIDPGCFNQNERNELKSFVNENNLKVVGLLNTHCHIDHVLGNNFVAQEFKVGLKVYQSEYDMLKMALKSAEVYQIPYDPSPNPESFLKEDETIRFGNSTFKIVYVPGHAPDHVVFVNSEEKIMIGGDVLFNGSIGRTDLPGGNHDQLLKNIKEKVFTLNAEIIVYSGHGEETTIGHEKQHNPFF
jgi:glyoxylase-like metal-dependent hydrolase (beta-lactamase superfamily II)